MKKFISNIIEKAGRHKTLIHNFSYLSALQVFNMILPLVTYPYLIRVLGKETYGLVIFAQAVISYFVILVGFGFNISATKEVSIHRENKEKLSEIVSSVLIIKGILFVFAFIILSILLYFIPQAKGYEPLFFLTMWMCLYEFIFPVWYFQGIEKMKYITYLTLTSRLIFLSLIFIFVNSRDDYLLVPLINGIGASFAGVIAVIFLIKEQVRFKMQPVTVLTSHFKGAYVMALAYASNTFKSNLNLIIVKFIFSFAEVAYFDLALKISNLGRTFLDIISQTVFPKMSREKSIDFFKNIFKLTLTASLLFVVFIQLFSEPIILILGGKDMFTANHVLRILVLYIPIYIAGALLGRNCLIVHGLDKQVLLSMLFSGVIYIALLGVSYLFGLKISLESIAIIYIASFTFETIYRYQICKSNQLI